MYNFIMLRCWRDKLGSYWRWA